MIEGFKMEDKKAKKSIDILRFVDNYIEKHIDEPFSVDELASYLQISVRHLFRIIYNTYNVSPAEYILRYRLSKRITCIQKKEQGYIESVPLFGFLSEKEFEKQFYDIFGIQAVDYIKNPIAVFNVFKTQENIQRYDFTNPIIVFVKSVSVINKKMIFKRAKFANSYMSFNVENDHNTFNAFSNTNNLLDEQFFACLPQTINKIGFSGYGLGVFVDGNSKIDYPEECEIINIPSVDYLLFKTYITDEGLPAIAAKVKKAVETFDFKSEGYQLANNIAPTITFAPFPNRGYIYGMPVIKAKTDNDNMF